MKTLKLSIESDLTIYSIGEAIRIFSQEFPDKRMYFIVMFPVFSIHMGMELRAFYDKAKPSVLCIHNENFHDCQWEIIAYDLYTYQPISNIISKGA